MRPALFPDIVVAMMDWAAATFFERTIHGLWLDPNMVKSKFDLDALRHTHRPLNEALMSEWSAIAPGSDASVVEFNFRAAGNAKRKLLRRLHGHVLLRRGGLRIRSATPLKRLADYTLAYEIIALECGGALLDWRSVASPLTE